MDHIKIALLAFLSCLLLIYFCYKYISTRVDYYIEDNKTRAELEETYVKTLAQITGGCAVVILFAYNIIKDDTDYQNTRYQLELSRNQATDLAYAETIKILDDKSTSSISKIAAIYNLERIASEDSSHGREYKEPIRNSLYFYVKDMLYKYDKLKQLKKHPDRTETSSERINSNGNAAIRVLGRTTTIPKELRYQLVLDDLYLAGADLSRLKGLKDIELKNCDFRNAKFDYSNLSGSDLSGSNMNLSEAYGLTTDEWRPRNSKITGQKFWDNLKYRYIATFTCTNLENTNLSHSGLRGAQFEGSILKNTKFKESDLSGANFEHARNLEEADFSTACADSTEKAKFPDIFPCELRTCNGKEINTEDNCKYKGLNKEEKEEIENKLAKQCEIEATIE